MIQTIEHEGKIIHIIGTAHVSADSAREVDKTITELKPDSVCIELDEGRYQNITNKDKWEKTNILTVIKEKKAGMFLANLILSSYQKRLADQFGINPGEEMLTAIDKAEEVEAKLVLCDRNIQTTFLRIWRKMGLWDKMKLLFSLIYSMIDNEEITEEQLEELKTEDMLQSALGELAKEFPSLKQYLVDERDIFLCEKIKRAPGTVIVAVVGAAHVPGILAHWHQSNDITEINQVPPKKPYGRIIGWSIPVLIILMVISTFSLDKLSALSQLTHWILYNGTFSAIGALLAGGNILSILVAFIAAPITSLNPLLAAGWFAGITEVFIRKPTVKDFDDLSSDLSSLKGIWRNKVTRTLLVVILANLGSVIGTYAGGIEIFKIFTKTVL